MTAVVPARLAVDAEGTVWRIFAPDGVGPTDETWSLAPCRHGEQGQQVEPVAYYVRAALLPSPPATTGAPTCGTCAVPLLPEPVTLADGRTAWRSALDQSTGCGVTDESRPWRNHLPSPPATTGATWAERDELAQAFHEGHQAGVETGMALAADRALAAASPPATDGDAADGGTR